MLLNNIKKLLLIAVVSGFVSNSYAAWGYHHHRGHTACRGGACHHSNVHRGCVNGHCGSVRHSSTWHR
jgi:hypothetical protein